MRHFFLGQAANYSLGEVFRHLFSVGTTRDTDALERHLLKRYSGHRAILCKNGRSALCLALKAYFEPGDAVLVNGFTCYAVYEAIKAAKLVPVFVDISRDDLNFDMNALSTKLDDSRPAPSLPSSRGSVAKKLPVGRNGFESPNLRAHERIAKGIIVQNTLGNPVDIQAIERFAKEHELVIIEDLAHCAGVKYADGRECGTVGAAAALSFGKDKSIDTISGGAVVFRAPCNNKIETPSKMPQPSCHLRARFYPLFGMISRGLSYVHLGGIWMRGLVKIHWVEKSADNRLDLIRRISKFEAKLALEQFERLKRSGEPPIREFALVDNRDEVLKELARAGYYFDGLWYKQPVSPERYYKKAHFPEKDCPNAVYIAERIVNFPTYYTRNDLKRAREIVKKHLAKEIGEQKQPARKETDE